MTATIRVEELFPQIIHVHATKGVELAKTFIRFQEHYESPRFAGETFTLEEYATWYTANSTKGKTTGKFTYYTDWRGFNIPSKIITSFREGKFDPLSEREQWLLEQLPNTAAPFYVIGTAGKHTDPTHPDNDVLRHEIAHGFYFTKPSYHHIANSIVNATNNDFVEQIQHMLRQLGYAERVFQDETHAYMGESPLWLREKGVAAVDKESVAAIRDLFKLSAGFDR